MKTSAQTEDYARLMQNVNATQATEALNAKSISPAQATALTKSKERVTRKACVSVSKNMMEKPASTKKRTWKT